MDCIEWDPYLHVLNRKVLLSCLDRIMNEVRGTFRDDNAVHRVALHAQPESTCGFEPWCPKNSLCMLL